MVQSRWLPLAADQLRRRLRRGLIVLMISALLVTSCPQRTKAVALEATVIAGVAAILTSIGVTYWAKTQADGNNYLAEKVEEYLDTLDPVPVSYEEWLEVYSPESVFSSLGGGILRFSSGVANKLLDFCRWYKTSTGLQSGGEPITQTSAGTYITRSVSNSNGASVSGVSLIIRDGGYLDIDISTFKLGSRGESTLKMSIPQTSGVTSNTVSVVGLTSGITASYTIGYKDSTGEGTNWDGSAKSLTIGNAITKTGNKPYLQVAIKFSGPRNVDIPVSVSLHLSGYAINPPQELVSVSPSESVTIPDNLASDVNLIVTTNAPTTAGQDSVSAADTILQTVATTEGLSSERQSAEGALQGWGWLQDTLIRVQGLISDIRQAINQDYGDVQSYQLDLTSVFPFCIPWDIGRAISLFAAEPVTPSISADFPVPWQSEDVHVEIDLHDYDDVASLLRWMELLAFGVGLALNTKRLIKW